MLPRHFCLDPSWIGHLEFWFIPSAYSYGTPLVLWHCSEAGESEQQSGWCLHGNGKRRLQWWSSFCYLLKSTGSSKGHNRCLSHLPSPFRFSVVSWNSFWACEKVTPRTDGVLLAKLITLQFSGSDSAAWGEVLVSTGPSKWLIGK